MRFVISALGLGVALLSPSTCRGSVDEIRSVFQALIASPDDSAASISPDLLSKMEAEINVATVEQVQSLLPLGERCLKSKSVSNQGAGLLLFTVIALRLDGSKLLGPYIDDFAGLLNETEVGLKNGAIYLLGRAQSAKALAILADHLNDRGNSRDQAQMMAAPLLESREAGRIQLVLSFVQERPDLNLKSGVIQMLGLYKVTSEDALMLIRGGLSDPEANTRRISLETIGRMPKDVRNRFAADLERLITLDPVSEVSNKARQVLISSQP